MPSPAGNADSVAVIGIGAGPWEFGLKAVDDTGNWSGLSNIVTTTISNDIIPPAAVTDLSVDIVTEGSVVLRWTASGDDASSGRAWAYDIRYADAPMTPETWEEATRVTPGPSPRDSGEGEIFAVPGLQPDITYYFALIVIDDVENASDVSNLANAAVSSAVQITFSTQSTLDPDWSPNGQSIIFNSQAEIQPGVLSSELFVIPASGGSAVRYTSILDGATQAAWSPDGTKIAFRMYVDGNRKVLGIMDALPGAQPQVLADHSGEAVSGPRWSPDGAKIAYVVTGPSYGQPPGSTIYTISSAGGSPELLAGDYTWIVSGLDWSPDGSSIAYSSNQNGSHHIFIIPSAGGPPTQVTNGSGNETTPAWSPDGSKIAYVTISPEEIWMVYRNGGYSTRVTFDAIHLPYRRVAWSPDGSMIAYGATENQSTNIWELKVK
jgi:Tol biopolymer transport system component